MQGPVKTVGEPGEALNHLPIISRNILRFGDISIQIIQFRGFLQTVVTLKQISVVFIPDRRRVSRILVNLENQFPAALPDRLELSAKVVAEEPLSEGLLITAEQGSQGLSIERPVPRK